MKPASPDSFGIRRRARIVLAAAGLNYSQADAALGLAGGTMAMHVGPNAKRAAGHRELARCYKAAGVEPTMADLFPEGVREAMAALLDRGGE